MTKQTQSYKLSINLGKGYFIYISPGLLDGLAMYKHISTISKTCVIISDSNVSKLYSEKLLSNFSKLNMNAELIVFPAGEANKSREQKNKIEDRMLSKGYGRDVCLLALGGGVVTDMAGFIAATYNRGIPAIYCPTSLLAMVDASLGGKTAVNTRHGKNLIGSFYQPESIYIDPNTLIGLPMRQFQHALVEVIVHALIADADLFRFLEEGLDSILQVDLPVISWLINKNCQIKKEIVEQDEEDNGVRMILNFGHTIGHAVEVCSGYQIPHGEAVSMGILVELYMAVQMEIFTDEEFSRVYSLLKRIKLPTVFSGFFSKKQLLEAIRLDKKSIFGEPRFVLLETIGKPRINDKQVVFKIPEHIINLGLDYLLDNFVRTQTVVKDGYV